MANRLTQSDMMSALFFDIETASEYRTFEALTEYNPQKADAFRHKMFYEKDELPIEEVYHNKAALSPEFGKIVCITMAHFDRTEDGSLYMKMGSLISPIDETGNGIDDRRLLRQTANFLNKKTDKKMCGWNTPNFDMPFILKHLLKADILPPLILDRQPQPREKNPVWAFDLMFYYRMGSEPYGNRTSLEVACAFLGLETPKDAMDGSQVNGEYWKGNIDGIKEYCEKDVIATARVGQCLTYSREDFTIDLKEWN